MEIPIALVLMTFAGLVWVNVWVKKKYGWLKTMYLLVPELLVLGYIAIHITGISIVIRDPF